MINEFLGVALVAAPFFIKEGTGTTGSLSQEWFFALSTMLGVMLFGFRAPCERLKISALALFGIAFLSANPFGLFQYYQLGMCFSGLVFIAFIYGNREEISLHTIQKCFEAICLIESVWIILQYIGVNPIEIWFEVLDERYRVVNLSEQKIFGSLGNINQSGALIACLIPFVRLALWILPVIALVVGGSAMSIICTLVAVITFYCYQKKNYAPLVAGGIFLATAAIALVTGMIPGNSFLSGTNRVAAWKELCNSLGLQLTGKGLGYIPEVFSANQFGDRGERFYQMHNEWAELYAVGGLLSVGVALYLILPVFKNKSNPAINACLISLLVNSLGNFTFHLAPLFMIFGTCYAFQIEKE